MTVKEFIKNKDNFIITKQGEILGIKNEGHEISFGKGTTDTSFLNEEVGKAETIKGVIEDITVIRI